MGVKMAIKCPKCQFENPDTQKFCGECSTQLKPAHAETRTLRTPAKDSTIGEIVSEKYKLLEELGSGGMGIVYKAEQIKPVKRSVALKIIKLGMDTKQVVARFETERQALAVMDHPNIAKVFDGGATETGRPYFVMEFIRGIPITEYCDKHKLTTRERLELFIQVCQAVQHAHQKGVIHRDLKPSNILVVVQEDKLIPKIIDFGIAKATEHRLTERTLFTEQGQLIGTPEYMSPEQAEMSGLDVDTRTDIYSLGVILYELLVGVLPFDPKTLREAGFGEILRIIRETDPPKVSTRLSGLGDTNTSIAKQRRTDVAALHKQLKGDLDWITMKAMEKDRTRRYPTASDLAVDLTRHLNEEPIAARPPSNIYTISKFIRRHKIGVTAAALVIMAILIGGIATIIGFVRATRAERLAKQEAETTKQVSDFLVDLFNVSDPSEARGNTITAREILDKGAERINQELKNQPGIQSTLLDTIGRVYFSLGLFDRALPLLESALEIRRETLGDEHLNVAESLNDLGIVLVAKGEYGRAEPLFQEALSLRRKSLGDIHVDVAVSLNCLGEVHYWRGDYSSAEPLFREALDIRRQCLGNESLELAASMNDLAMTLKQMGKYKEAEPLYRDSLAIRRKLLGEEHPSVAQSLNNLGMFLYQMFRNQENDGEEAGQLLRQALELNRRLMGEEHPEVSTSLNNLAMLLRDKGEYDQAEAMFRRVMELDRKSLGNEHPYVAGGMRNLAVLLMKKSDYKNAASLLNDAFEIQHKTFPENHWQIATTKLLLGVCSKETKEYKKAESLMITAYSIINSRFGVDHPRTQVALNSIVNLYESWGKPDKAEEYRVMLKKREIEK